VSLRREATVGADMKLTEGTLPTGARTLVVAVTLVATLHCLIMPTVSAQNAGPVASTLSTGFMFTEASGEALYANVCQACHMPDGKGATGAGTYPAIASDKTLEAAGYAIDVVEGKFFGRVTRERARARVVVHRIIAAGDYVWAHVNFLNLFNDDPNDAGIAGVDIYKFDADGKAIEHWDTLQLVGDPKNSVPMVAPNIPRANPNGMF
jgi:mono/diheme cytochrome c family protein